MHFCSDELVAIVNALQVSPAAYFHWAKAYVGKIAVKYRSHPISH